MVCLLAACPLHLHLLLSLGQGLEGREPMVIIVDDSSAVWPHDRRSLFVVERYVYFPSSRKRGGMSGRSLLEIDRWVRGWEEGGAGRTDMACRQRNS